MLDPHQILASLFIMLNKNPFVLIRIEFLVIAISGLFLAMFIMDFRRNRSHAPVRKSILKILDGISDNMVVYTLGAMQGAPFRNQLFPVWAMVVVSFGSSINYISRRESGGLETGNLMRPLGLAFLNSRRGSKLKVQLWTLWAVMVLRSSYRMLARLKASTSWWNGHSVGFITEYMRVDHEDTNLRPDACNASTVEGYKYLIYGEMSQQVDVQRPRYIVFLNILRPRQLVTLDKVWQCDGRLLRSSDSRGEHAKDMCLAFTLSGILRCQLVDDAALHRDSLFLTRNLVRSKILMRSASRAFRILEMELTFLNDTLHTRYPIVFWRGLFSLSLSLAVSLLTLGVACWLAADIRRIYRPPEGDLMQVVRGANVDIIITWVLMLFVMFKEIWEMVTYLLSDWTRLLLVCKYVEWSCGCMRNSVTEKLIWSFFTSKIGSRWHGLVDQYEFLRSFDYIPSVWNGLHRATLGMTPRKNNGAKLGTAIKVPECVRPAVMRTLRYLIKHADDGGGLPNEIPSLTLSSATASGGGDLTLTHRFGWACRLSTSSQVIMVWHIATSLCEIRFALHHGVDLSKPGILRRALSWTKSVLCCSSQPPYLVGESIILDGDLKANYVAANCLSRYCAYLLISQPLMLPDSFLLPDLIFNATVQDAGQILEGKDSLHDRYTRLTDVASSKTVEEKDTIRSAGNLVEQGAVLAWDLLQLNNSELLWKTLAGVWVDLVVHIAPSLSTAAHKTGLESGGEFLSHIWALLCHLGIRKSSLWPGEQAAAAGP